MENKKAFTLIELVSVLVILAILTLIVTPLVLNIIRKARIAADKRSIDAYGRSIELAVADYLLDNGTFPTSIEQLTIEYSGDTVSCSTTQLNDDSSAYLSGCTVGNRAVEGYTYGTDKSPTYDAYEVGDEVTYNGVDYYVIKNSGIKESSVTLLKATPLMVEEVNTYGRVGTANNHVNIYVSSNLPNYQTAYDNNGYGGMAYYSSTTCGYDGSNWVSTGCTTDYEQSEVKYVVDTWKAAKAPQASDARLITYDELTEDLGFEFQQINPTTQGYKYTENTPTWVYSNDYSYWTMSQYETSSSAVWSIKYNGGGYLANASVSDSQQIVVRPVITISKSALN